MLRLLDLLELAYHLLVLALGRALPLRRVREIHLELCRLPLPRELALAELVAKLLLPARRLLQPDLRSDWRARAQPKVAGAEEVEREAVAEQVRT